MPNQTLINYNYNISVLFVLLTIIHSSLLNVVIEPQPNLTSYICTHKYLYFSEFWTIPFLPNAKQKISRFCSSYIRTRSEIRRRLVSFPFSIFCTQLFPMNVFQSTPTKLGRMWTLMRALQRWYECAEKMSPPFVIAVG